MATKYETVYFCVVIPVWMINVCFVLFFVFLWRRQINIFLLYHYKARFAFLLLVLLSVSHRPEDLNLLVFFSVKASPVLK